MRNVTVQEEKKNGNEKILRADVTSFDNKIISVSDLASFYFHLYVKQLYN